MSELVTLITCTGARPEAFKLCAGYVARQTYKGPIQWIVVDDFNIKATQIPPLPAHVKLEFVKAKTQWREGYNTQRSNMNEALAVTKGSLIAVIEDDDWYSPEYLEANLAYLGAAKVVGETKNRYYNVKVPGYTVMGNTVHSSLASTVFRRELLPVMDKAVNSGDFYFDIIFWRMVTDLNTARVFHNDTGLYIGIKGLPGKPGLTGSHRDSKNFMFDPECAKLKAWMGEADAAKYRMFIKQKEVSNANPQKQESTVRQSYRRVSEQRKIETEVQVPSRTSSPLAQTQKKF